jgi:hypothetical protein
MKFENDDDKPTMTMINTILLLVYLFLASVAGLAVFLHKFW